MNDDNIEMNTFAPLESVLGIPALKSFVSANDDLHDIANQLALAATLAHKGGPVYLATPYTKYALGQEEAARRAAAYAGELINIGLPTFCPIAHGHAVADAAGIDKLDVDFWITANESMLRASSSLIVVKMDGWRESKGVAIEIDAFVKAGKPVVYLEEGFFLDFVVGGIHGRKH